jgi:UDP-glucose 4-epimerase
VTDSGEFHGAKVLVTGGAGFIGSNIVKRLLAEGARVIVLDDFSTGQHDNLPAPGPMLRIEAGTVTDREWVWDLVQEVDAVIHTAARNIIVSTKDPREDFEVNIGGTLNVLEALRRTTGKRMVYTSSASVYGNPRYLPINEDDRTNVLSPYAASKLGGENYCKAFYECYQTSTRVVRYSNVYGPGQRTDNPYCGVIAKFFESAMRSESLQAHGDGEQTRDFTYVDDAVEATLRALTLPRAEGQVYNVGTGRETSVNQLAQLVIATTGRHAPLQHIDRRDIDNIRRRVVNIEKIRSELRWVPSFTIETGLERTFAWLIAEQTRLRS